MFSFQFYVDYSVKGTAKCQKCKRCIVKGELRIAKPAIYKKMEIKRYFHVECLFHSFSRSRTLENIITSNNQIEGFTLIKKGRSGSHKPTYIGIEIYCFKNYHKK